MDLTQSLSRERERPDNPVFEPESMKVLLTAIERKIPNFPIMFVMYLGVPSLQIIRLSEKCTEPHSEGTAELGELCFREWFTSKKLHNCRELDRFKEIMMALNSLDKPLFAEILQQKFIEGVPLKIEDFHLVMLD